MTEQSQDAVEALAVWHYNLTHDTGEKTGTPWVKASEAEKERCLNEARFRLGVLQPKIEAQTLDRVREALTPLLDEYTEAVEAWSRGEKEASLRVNDLEKRILAALNPSEGER